MKDIKKRIVKLEQISIQSHSFGEALLLPVLLFLFSPSASLQGYSFEILIIISEIHRQDFPDHWSKVWFMIGYAWKCSYTIKNSSLILFIKLWSLCFFKHLVLKSSQRSLVFPAQETMDLCVVFYFKNMEIKWKISICSPVMLFSPVSLQISFRWI